MRSEYSDSYDDEDCDCTLCRYERLPEEQKEDIDAKCGNFALATSAVALLLTVVACQLAGANTVSTLLASAAIGFGAWYLGGRSMATYAIKQACK